MKMIAMVQDVIIPKQQLKGFVANWNVPFLAPYQQHGHGHRPCAS
jgi:hypothetical protein